MSLLIFTWLELGLIVKGWHLVVESITRMASLFSFVACHEDIFYLHSLLNCQDKNLDPTCLIVTEICSSLTDQEEQQGLESIIGHDHLAWLLNWV